MKIPLAWLHSIIYIFFENPALLWKEKVCINVQIMGLTLVMYQKYSIMMNHPTITEPKIDPNSIIPTSYWLKRPICSNLPHTSQTSQYTIHTIGDNFSAFQQASKRPAL